MKIKSPCRLTISLVHVEQEDKRTRSKPTESEITRRVHRPRTRRKCHPVYTGCESRTAHHPAHTVVLHPLFLPFLRFTPDQPGVGETDARRQLFSHPNKIDLLHALHALFQGARDPGCALPINILPLETLLQSRDVGTRNGSEQCAGQIDVFPIFIDVVAWSK